jgi:hypothetical protein
MASDTWEEIFKEFVALVIKSPVAIMTVGVSTCFGYGIAFILFDYRRTEVRKSHRVFHVAIGLGYAAVIFCIVNYDLLSRGLTVEQITSRAPLTLLISAVVSFIIMTIGAFCREFSNPYYKPRGSRRPNGDGS